MEIILKDAGSHFDPTLIDLSLEVMDDFKNIALMHKDDNSFEVYEDIYL
jgi:HD-GYP domain-containing protein (c-di-GMP phosphodiesterase class II)